MATRPRKLTAKAVEQAKPRTGPDGPVRTEVPDAGKPGLYLVVQPSGKKSWAVRYRRLSDGKPRKLTLDGFPSLARAHKLAQVALDAVAEGADPATEKKEAKRAVALDEGHDLFGKAVVDFIERYAKRRNRSWLETARLLGLRPDPGSEGEFSAMDGGLAHDKKWGKRRLSEITRRDVIDLLDDIVDRGAPYTANRTLAALRKFFNWSVGRDVMPVSPCAGVKPPTAEVSRDRILSEAELCWFWLACDKLDYPFGPLFKVLLVTAQRREEVGEMTTAEMSCKTRLWTIPANRTKNKRVHEVPLSDFAVAIIKSAPRITSKAGYIFTTNGKTPVSGYSKAKAAVSAEMLALAREEAKRAGHEAKDVAIERWTLHDLRRTAATKMGDIGVQPHIVEATLNHISGSKAGVAGVYNRAAYASEKRAALELWGQFLAELTSGNSAKVVPLRAAG